MSKINVLILGKSGSGKSSLLNFLWGDNVAKAAAGRPVTPKEGDGKCGIYPFDPITRSGIEIVIYDSWGMEADKADEWRQLIEEQMEDRESSGNVEDWFHSIIYCISAKGARIEEFEIESIIRPLIKKGNSVVFALTKSDIASDDERSALQEILKNNFPSAGIVNVCSVSQKLRNGKIKEAFGLDVMNYEVMRGLRNNLINKIKSNFIKYCFKKSMEWKSDVLFFYDKNNNLFKNRDSLFKEVSDYSEKKRYLVLSSTEEWLVDAISGAQLIFDNFGIMLHKNEYMNEYKNINCIEARDTPLIKENVKSWAVKALILVFPFSFNIFYKIIEEKSYRIKIVEKLDEVNIEFNNKASYSLSKIEYFLKQSLFLENFSK